MAQNALGYKKHFRRLKAVSKISVYLLTFMTRIRTGSTTPRITFTTPRAR